MTLEQERVLNKVREEIKGMRIQLDWVMYYSDSLPEKEFKKIRDAYDLICKANDSL